MMLGGSPKVDSRLNKIVSCVEPKSLSDIMQHLGLKGLKGKTLCLGIDIL